MATTIQVVENVTIEKYVDINGVRCEVEAVTNELTITQSRANEELLRAMASTLLMMNVIQKREDGQYYFVESGKPLVPEFAYMDD